MDEPLNRRQEILMRRLSARTRPDGSAKPNYAENVAALRAELAIIQEKLSGAQG